MPENVTASRKALHAYVSDGAHDQWHNFAAEQGITLSALLDVLGTEISDPTNQEQGMSERLEFVVAEARKTDARRRRRGR